MLLLYSCVPVRAEIQDGRSLDGQSRAGQGGADLSEQLQRELADRKIAEEALQRSNHQLLLLNQVGQLFSSSLELDHVLETGLGEIQRLLDAFSTSFWLLDPATNVFRRANFPLFVSPTNHDYRLISRAFRAATTRLPAVAIELPDVPGAPTAEVEPPLAWQYRHPAAKEKRPAQKSLTLGAYARSATSAR